MDPDQRKAALAKYMKMDPTPEREALRKAIEASDALDAARENLRKAEQKLLEATTIHGLQTDRLASLQQAHDAAAPDVAALLKRLQITA